MIECWSRSWSGGRPAKKQPHCVPAGALLDQQCSSEELLLVYLLEGPVVYYLADRALPPPRRSTWSTRRLHYLERSSEHFIGWSSARYNCWSSARSTWRLLLSAS